MGGRIIDEQVVAVVPAGVVVVGDGGDDVGLVRRRSLVGDGPLPLFLLSLLGVVLPLPLFVVVVVVAVVVSVVLMFPLGQHPAAAVRSLSLRVTLLCRVHVYPPPPQSFFLPIIWMVVVMTTGTIAP